MEFKITKNQIIGLATTGNHYTERYLQSVFPEAFNTPEWTPAPTEKTVITREKALKILAKKLKVSPENIEIE